MKTFVLTILLTALTGGIACAAGYDYGSCAGNNGKACTDARNAFAEHHNGQYPERYYSQWYQGQQGRWNQQGSDWRWEGARGQSYAKGQNGWQWSGARDAHHRD
jgi:hypothetical protein